MLVLVVIVENNLVNVFKIKSFHEGHNLIIDDFQETFQKSMTVGQIIELRENNSLQYTDNIFHTKYNWVISEVKKNQL